MSTSQKQIDANRQNAQKSTGPVTENGKAASSKNAVKHGFYSSDAVIVSPHLTEDQAEYDRLVEGLIAELDPQTAFQECLVQRIANCLWRLRRAVIVESAQIHRQLDTAYRDYCHDARERASYRAKTQGDSAGQFPDEPSDVLTNLINNSMMPYERFSINLLRYELRIDRQLQRAYELFRRLKQNPGTDPSPRPPTPDKTF